MWGSSETLRGAAFSTVIVTRHVVHNKPESDAALGQYLAGLFEGDGHLSKQKTIIVTLGEHDLKLLLQLRKLVGHGNVRKVKDKKAYNWVISNKAGVDKFLSFIDGHLRTTAKLSQVHSRGVCFKQQTPNLSNPNHDWWFAGFTEAEGCFYLQVLKRWVMGTSSASPQTQACVPTKVGITKQRREARLSLKFGLKDQEVLKYIRNWFGGSKVFPRHAHNSDTFYWGSTNLSSATNVIKYFDQFSLQGEKLQKYLKWRKVYSLILNKEHLTDSGFDKICQYKADWQKIES